MRRLSIFAAMTVAFASAGLFTGCDDCCDRDRIVDVRYETPAPIPAGVYTVTGDGEVQVYWSPVRGSGVLGYGVYRSRSYDGEYSRIADVSDEESDFYLDTGLQNGTTYYYAVDSYTDDDESDLSYENAADTPRPAGSNVVLFDSDVDPGESGLDFTVVQDGISRQIVVAWNDPWSQYYVFTLDGLLRMVPTAVEYEGETFYNDIQDFGYTDHLDDINFAPDAGWSLDPVGVEMIEGHTYILWTWDDHFAKVRVVAVSETHVVLDWAYQTSDDEIERYQLKNPDLMARKWNRAGRAG